MFEILGFANFTTAHFVAKGHNVNSSETQEIGGIAS